MLKISSCGNGKQNIDGKWQKTAQQNDPIEDEIKRYLLRQDVGVDSTPELISEIRRIMEWKRGSMGHLSVEQQAEVAFEELIERERGASRIEDVLNNPDWENGNNIVNEGDMSSFLGGRMGF